MAEENVTTDSGSGIDIDKAVSSIAQDLGFEKETEDEVVEETTEETPDVVEEETAPVEESEETPVTEEPETKIAVREPPKSWSKDKHELWSKLPPEAQEYYELRENQMLSGIESYKDNATYGKTLKDVITPYEPILQAAGLDAPKAVQYLLNAHYRLTNGSPEQRKAAYEQLGQNLGLIEGQIDPKFKMLQDELYQIKNTLTQREQVALQETQSRVSKEVETFASDKPYFDEVADDIVAYINAGLTLDKAYEKAIWANPVTRQKEISRLDTERNAKLQKKAVEAQKAKNVVSHNVRSRDTSKAPTEPKGTMEDTLTETYRTIRERAH